MFDPKMYFENDQNCKSCSTKSQLAYYNVISTNKLIVLLFRTAIFTESANVFI